MANDKNDKNSGKISALVLDRLYETAVNRRTADANDSYTAKLFARGTKRIAKKLGEEAVEVVIEMLRGDKEKLAAESADLLYHLVVAWADAKIRPEDVYRELAEREGVGGLVEKRSRKDLGDDE